MTEIEKLIADLTRMAATISDNASREERPLKRKLMEANARTVDQAAAALRAMQAETERLRGERDAEFAVTGGRQFGKSHAYRVGVAYGEAKAKAAAEAKLAEVEKERDEWKSRHFKMRDDRDAKSIAASNYGAMARENRIRAEAAEATVATLTAQVEAMRGALDNINSKAFMNAGEFARYVREQIAALTTEKTNG